MLKVLSNIVQILNNSSEGLDILPILVEQIADAIRADACSVFLFNPQKKEYWLVATYGLNPACVRQVRLKNDEGLVGLVGRKEEPINLANASSHPCFHPVPELREEAYIAFLGVPLIHQRQLLGVLLVQQVEERCFDESEVAFMMTVATHMASTLAHWRASGQFKKLFTPTEINASIELHGLACSPGIGIGTGVIFYHPANLESIPDRNVENIEAEIERFNIALERTCSDIEHLKQRMESILPSSELALFDAYLQLLEENSLGGEIRDHIINQRQWAQGALRYVIKQHVRQFEQLTDPYLKERAQDLRDLGRQILANLESLSQEMDYPLKTILVGDELSAAALAEVPSERLVGIVCKKSSSYSHLAILARAMKIPAVLGIENLNAAQLDHSTIIVDGDSGTVLCQPTARQLKHYQTLAAELRAFETHLQNIRTLPAQTLDQFTMPLFVNVGLASDAGAALSVGAEGVGLFRTEVPFLTRPTFPTEEEQRILYSQALKIFAPRPVIMRTLDIGGDKILPYFEIKEENPFLGWRGIRITLDHPELFSIQVRAMLKANIGFENLRILLPMITSVTELDDAIELIRKAHQEVQEECQKELSLPPIGAMIEVPSAVYQAKAIARRVRFLSVGTNDLVQYLLAVDRNNSRVAGLYDYLHPAVLRALQQIVEAAHSEGKQVSVCGEMAGDPIGVFILLALGFDALSMSPVYLLRIKWLLRQISRKYTKEIFTLIRTFEDPKLIRARITQALEEIGLGQLIQKKKKEH